MTMNPEARKELGARMKKYRQRRTKHTQAEMAKIANRTPSAYQSYEDGRAEPPTVVLLLFCEACRLKLDTLLRDLPLDACLKS